MSACTLGHALRNRPAGRQIVLEEVSMCICSGIFSMLALHAVVHARELMHMLISSMTA